MSRKISKAGTWGGAGSSETWDAQEGPVDGTHWYKLRDSWISDPDSRYSMPVLWQEAIKDPGKEKDAYWKQGTGPGSDCYAFAQYDPDRRQMLSGLYDCPARTDHHLYQTCWCCGQYG